MEDQLSGYEPPPPTSAAVLGAPVPLIPLIGRVEEAAEIIGLLDRTRLLTVTGPGGGGKTRLALAVAEQWATAHRTGRVAWVSLAATEEPELVVEHLATVVGAAGPTAAEVAAGIGGSDGLIVLDNCEHLVGAVADLVGALLVAAPSVRVLATSRTPLRLAGERRWPLPPLRTPGANDGTDVLGYDAVRLFVDRARAIRPDFALGSRDAAVVAAICRRLDGNPLAIELCAARIQVLGVSQLAAGLDDAGRLLAGRDRSGPRRHRTLWDALDWSHRLLSDDEARLFATLGVFAGSPDLETVSAVHGSDSLDTLTALVEHSLVRPTPDPVRDIAGKRYELADPVRQYARLRLHQSGRDGATRDTHLGWCAERARAAFAQAGHAAQSTWFARLRGDLPDLRAALGWAHATGQTWSELRLAADLAPFATASGLHREGRGWLEQALDSQGANEDGRARVEPAPDDAAALIARARQAAGTLAFLQCDYSSATWHLERAEAAFRALADQPGRARCLQSLASIARERGDYRLAVETLEQACACWTGAGDDEAAALAAVGLAFTVLLEGSTERARSLAEQGLAAAHARADTGTVTDILIVLGGAALADGDLETAGRCLEDALSRAVRDDLAEARAYALEWLAILAREQTQPERSASLLAEALQRQYELGDLWRTASVLVNVAVCELGHGRPVWAARAVSLADAMLDRIGAVLPPVDAGTRARVGEQLASLLAQETLDRERRAVKTAALGDAIGSLRQSLLSTPSDQGPSDPPNGCDPLDLRGLGEASVRLNGRALSPGDFSYAKPRELLYFLAERAPVDKSQIGLALWPEASPRELRSAFHTTLHHLRRAVGADRVVFAHGRYRLAESSLRYDVAGFRDALAAARAVRDSQPDGGSPLRDELDLLEHALSLYPGDFLPTVSAAWVEASRDELRTVHRRALLAAARCARRSGLPARAVAAYERLIELDPLAEIAHRELMVCFATLGERARALQQYQLVRTTLHDELGVEPDPQTTAVRDNLQNRAVAAR